MISLRVGSDSMEIKENLQRYSRKLQVKQMITGGIISSSLLVGVWIALSLMEYELHLGISERTILFFSFVATTLSVLGYLLFIPFLRWLRLLPSRSNHDLALEIGRDIPQVEDQLLNFLALENERQNNALVHASLEQKSLRFVDFDFSQTVNLRSSLQILRVAIIPMLLACIILLWDSSLLMESGSRLVQFNKSFIPPAPFTFNLENQLLQVAEGNDLEIVVSAEGKAVPENAFVLMNDAEFRMKRLSTGSFSFLFKNVRKDLDFQLRGASVYSAAHSITVLPKPRLVETEVYADYPAYTGLKNESFTNRSRLEIPEGTELNFQFLTSKSKTLQIAEDGMSMPIEIEDNIGVYKSRMTEGQNLIVITNNTSLSDTATIAIAIIPDQFPAIKIYEHVDSSNLSFRYFNGECSDDYGISKAAFNVSMTTSGFTTSQIIALPIADRAQQTLSHLWNVDSLITTPGQKIEYFFEVWDNDGINGAKSTRSAKWTYTVPSLDDMKTQAESQSDESKKALETNMDELTDMQEEIDALKKDLLQKKKPEWQDRERLEDLLKQQKEMIKNLEEKSTLQRTEQEKLSRFEQMDEDLMQKQEQIQKMFEELFDDEFKEKYEEWNELLEELSKEEMLKTLEQMEMDHEKLEKQLDRTLELFKQLEFEKKLDESIQKVDELIKEQEELIEETDNKQNSEDELSEKQEELNEELEELQEELEELEEMNKELEEPNELPESAEEKAEEASQKMEEAADDLSGGKRKKGKESQEGAKENLEEMQESLSQFQEQMAQDQQAENLDDMRQLLENIVDLSHAQEDVMENIKGTKLSDPKYIQLAKTQKDIVDDVKTVEDSLLALSKRVPQLDRVINDEITSVKHNMDKALSNLTNQPPNQERRYKEMAAQRQQLAMTSLNNLALLFDEIIRDMQSDLSEKAFGKGACKNPGNKPGGKPSAGDMKKMQKNLNKQLQKLKEAMEKGQNPNGKKPGGMPGMPGMSKELSQMAAQQAAIRQQLRQLSESLSEEKGGKQGGNALQEIQELMEQTEEDILYGKISAQTMQRQQDILTKLLESEKADRERELDKERQSKSSTISYDVPEEIWELYLQNKEREVELYKTVPPNLKPFYRKRVNRYFSTFSD